MKNKKVMNRNTENKISTNLWFNTQAEEAAKFYAALFKNSSIGKVDRYGTEGQEVQGKPDSTVMTVEFQLENQHFVGLNGGPQFKFNPSISFFVGRETKEEIDGLWKKLSDEGEVLMPLQSYPFSEHYGWVQDKYGVSWQLILQGTDGERRPPIVPSMLFVGDQCGNAEEALKFYQTVFERSKAGNMARYGADQAPNGEGTIMYSDFAIENQWFAAMDSAQDHDFQFNEAISFIVNCDTQEEVDHHWQKLSADPSAERCGWLKDRFGVSWQIVPKVLPEMLNDADPKKSEAVRKAMQQMKKLNISALEEAAEGR